MVAALIVCVLAVAYLAAGTLVARWATPGIVARETYRGSDHSFSKDVDGDCSVCWRRYRRCVKEANHGRYIDRSNVACRQFFTLALWPLMGPVVVVDRSIVGTLRSATDKLDPDVARRRAERIAELEREAGLA